MLCLETWPGTLDKKNKRRNGGLQTDYNFARPSAVLSVREPLSRRKETH